MIPDHGRDIGKYEFSELSKFQKCLEEASLAVKTWPAWKRGILNGCCEAQLEISRKYKVAARQLD